MAGKHNFEHLPLLLRYSGAAKIRGGGKVSPQTKANRQNSAVHSGALREAASALSENWQTRRAQREEADLPAIESGVPILLQIDPNLDLDDLRRKFSFEIVSEQEEGFVIVASEDIEISSFVEMATNFATRARGSGAIASVHRLFDDPEQTDRLRRILSDSLFANWGALTEEGDYMVDVGISCTGTEEIPARPKRGVRATDEEWAEKEANWSAERNRIYNAWDEIKARREHEIVEFMGFYGASIKHMVDEGDFSAGVLPDSFTVRIVISGKGLRDFVLNYPYIFEVVEPEDVELPQAAVTAAANVALLATPTAPKDDCPAICVIDSGIQEGHALISPAIDGASSRCFLPGVPASDVGDHVSPGGHGTRVAGAVLYGELVPKSGTPQLPFWIQNARVLDAQNHMPAEAFPPAVIRAAVESFHKGARNTRVFNHSINSNGPCRTRHMSAWAAEIDQLSTEYDVLVVQSAGNIQISGPLNSPGVKDHLEAGRSYPDFLCESSSRITSPAQSLQALTVGSISYEAAAAGPWAPFAPAGAHPSAFSRSGPGIWGVIKPEVVECGGDFVRTANVPVDVQSGGAVPAACPELVRSTMFPPGPALDRDDVGTSYAAPKVARIAGEIARVLPTQSALLYRALIVQSAQWPGWAEQVLDGLRAGDFSTEAERQGALSTASRVIRYIGYGIPTEFRATKNTDSRTTLITQSDGQIKAGECHVYQVPVPAILRQPGDEFRVRIDVTLSYVARPRRTRRNLRRYLSTWVNWKSSHLGESLDAFRVRALKDVESNGEALAGSGLPWTI